MHTLTYGQKLIAEAIEAHFGERIENYDEDVDDTSNRDAWEAFDALAALSQAEPAGVAEQEGAHPDDIAVDQFAAAMKAKLAKKRDEGRGGWEGPTCNAEILSIMLRKHVRKGDPVDVANLAMMLHQRGEGIV